MPGRRCAGRCLRTVVDGDLTEVAVDDSVGPDVAQIRDDQQPAGVDENCRRGTAHAGAVTWRGSVDSVVRAAEHLTELIRRCWYRFGDNDAITIIDDNLRALAVRRSATAPNHSVRALDLSPQARLTRSEELRLTGPYEEKP